MYLVDTNVISEQRKKAKANSGVKRFFRQAVGEDTPFYISVITVGELRRGVEMIRNRGDKSQADLLETWLLKLLEQHADHILDFTVEEAQVWGRLRVPHYENALDKQIAATALVYGLTLVTRDVDDFTGTGVQLINPFE